MRSRIRFVAFGDGHRCTKYKRGFRWMLRFLRTVRTFVDEGPRMASLLSEAAANGIMPEYATRLLTAFEAEDRRSEVESDPYRCEGLVEELSRRELEVLRLVAQGLSNREISERLFLALSTVKGHNLKIFEKLQVKSRTEAMARAGKMGLLKPKKQ